MRHIIHRIFYSEWDEASANVYQLQHWAAANDPPPAPPANEDTGGVEGRVARAVDVTLRLLCRDFSAPNFTEVFGFPPTTSRATLIWIQYSGIDRTFPNNERTNTCPARFENIPLAPTPWPTLSLPCVAPDNIVLEPGTGSNTV